MGDEKRPETKEKAKKQTPPFRGYFNEPIQVLILQRARGDTRPTRCHSLLMADARCERSSRLAVRKTATLRRLAPQSGLAVRRRRQQDAGTANAGRHFFLFFLSSLYVDEEGVQSLAPNKHDVVCVMEVESKSWSVESRRQVACSTAYLMRSL